MNSNKLINAYQRSKKEKKCEKVVKRRHDTLVGSFIIQLFFFFLLSFIILLNTQTYRQTANVIETKYIILLQSYTSSKTNTKTSYCFKTLSSCLFGCSFACTPFLASSLLGKTSFSIIYFSLPYKYLLLISYTYS